MDSVCILVLHLMLFKIDSIFLVLFWYKSLCLLTKLVLLYLMCVDLFFFIMSASSLLFNLIEGFLHIKKHRYTSAFFDRLFSYLSYCVVYLSVGLNPNCLSSSVTSSSIFWCIFLPLWSLLCFSHPHKSGVALDIIRPTHLRSYTHFSPL